MRTNAMWVLVLGMVACYRVPATPPVQPSPQPTATSSAELDRGKYVATISGCIVCHGNDLAGGHEAKLPDGSGGSWRAPNLTTDPMTGLGRWTDEQIDAAVRQGMRPDGARLLPIMPYGYYHHMTDADARALVSYLRSVPAVEHRVARSDASTALKPLELEAPAGNVDTPALHGEYLANLMHCAACHTPSDGRAFAGGTTFDTLTAPNITSDRATGIGAWTEDDIVRAVRTMTVPDGSKIEGPMAMYASAWSQLTDADAHALAGYITSIPAIEHDVGHQREQTEQPGTH